MENNGLVQDTFVVLLGEIKILTLSSLEEVIIANTVLTINYLATRSAVKINWDMISTFDPKFNNKPP